MHIKDFDEVVLLNKLRDHYIERIKECESRLGITIDGRYQDDLLVDEMRPHVVLHLNIRLNKVEQQLTDYGVVF